MIYHWCPKDDWNPSADSYEAESLREEGFIHFSFRDQVAPTATAIDGGRSGMVLLCVDDSQLDVVVEDTYEIGEEFPHVYSAIPTKAVIRVIPFPSESDGSFSLPEGA
jgi:uncharacterized protein (DUF952 family)